MKTAKIYKLENSINSKYYIGSTKAKYLNDRFCSHKRDSKKIRNLKNKLYIEMNKIGINNWKITLIENFSFNLDRELRYKEDTYIDLNDINCLNVKRSIGIYRDEYNSKEEYEKARYILNAEKDKIRERKKPRYINREKHRI